MGVKYIVPISRLVDVDVDRELTKAHLAKYEHVVVHTGFKLADEIVKEPVTKLKTRSVKDNSFGAAPIKREGGVVIDDPQVYREELNKAQRAILDALAWLHAHGIEKPDRKMLSAIANYRGGHFTNTLGLLKTASLICYPTTGAVSLTEEAHSVAVVKDDDRPAVEQWKDGMSAAEKKVFDVLVSLYDDNMSNPVITRARLSELSGYAGGHFTNTLGSLRTMGAIEYPSKGMVSLSKHVVP